VHSDFIQIAANLGVIPGLLFAGAFLWTAFRLFLLVRDCEDPARPLRLALLLSFITAGGIMSTQVICVLPQLACPVWLIWVLAAVAVRQQGKRVEAKSRAGANFRFAANLQLREYGPEHAGVRAGRS